MSASTPTPPASASPALHLRRAFGWNLGRMAPTAGEAEALAAAGVADPVVQRYAAWRRSLLLVAAVPMLVAAVLAVLDTVGDGFGEETPLGVALDFAWLLAAATLPVACLSGVKRWKQPGAASALLRTGWMAAFLIPFVRALIPADLLNHVHDLPAIPAALGDEAAAYAAKIQELGDMALSFVLAGGEYLLLLPAVLSLIPGAMNGCLRIKSALPAAQLPGWLLVCAAPVFLLFWLVILVIANEAAQSPLLLFGVLLWAGGPIVYSLRGRVFVQSQISEQDAAKIARVKRVVGLVSLAGVAMMVAFVMTQKVAGLHVVGFDRESAMSTKLDELSDSDDEFSLDDVKEAYATSTSLAYAGDMSSYRFVVDFLAKLLLTTAVFADLVLRATLAAWRNDRELRARAEASAYDASAAAAIDALSRRREG